MPNVLKKLASCVILAVAASAPTHAATITISCGSNAADLEFCGKYAEDWGKANGHTVKLFSAPASATDYLALLRQQMAAKSSDIDILLIDIVWPGVVKDHLLDLKKYSKGIEAKHFPAIVANNTVDGRLVAEAQLMCAYRKLPIPEAATPPAESRGGDWPDAPVHAVVSPAADPLEVNQARLRGWTVHEVADAAPGTVAAAVLAIATSLT